MLRAFASPKVDIPAIKRGFFILFSISTKPINGKGYP